MQMPDPLPRLMTSLELAQPKLIFETALFAWASRSGIEVTCRSDLLTLSNKYAILGSHDAERTAIDIGIGLDVLDALSKAMRTHFVYEAFWRYKLLEAGADQAARFIAIIELQQKFGGILLDAVETPHSVIIPRPNGTYILAGHEDFFVLDASPLGANMDQVAITHAAHIIRRYQINNADDHEHSSAMAPPTQS